MSFTQIITVEVSDEQALRDHIANWDREQSGEAPGYVGSRVLADQDQPGSFLIEVDFTSQEEAQRNNDRPETQQWAEQLRSLVDGDPSYRNLRRVFATDGA
jgi:quinol monooxygenase YgiN